MDAQMQASGTLSSVANPNKEPQIVQVLDRLQALVHNTQDISVSAQVQLSRVLGAASPPTPGQTTAGPPQRPGLIGRLEDITDALAEANNSTSAALAGLREIL